MQVVHFIYNEQEVDFLPAGNENLMVNATQMAKIFGKDLFQFTKSENTKSFIEACLKPANAGLLCLKNEEDLIVSKQKSGTWMHRVLALKFAAWLDSDFEVWVYSTIDTILFGHYKELRAATEEKIRAEQQLQSKRAELLQKYPEFVEFLEMEGKITEADKKRTKALQNATRQLKLELFPQNN